MDYQEIPADAVGLPKHHQATHSEKLIITASSLGTVFEWYDFYLYGLLTSIIAAKFLTGLNPTTSFIMALLVFAAGFIVRPFGALVFGKIGDTFGRRYTFIITLVVMGLSTFLVGCLPTYDGRRRRADHAGRPAHVPGSGAGRRIRRRGHLRCRTCAQQQARALYQLDPDHRHGGPGHGAADRDHVRSPVTGVGEDAFKAWGWRVPYLLSGLFLVVGLWLRLKLHESPVFQKMKSEGTASKAPLTEAFGEWKNLKVVLIAFFGAIAGQAVIWYTGQLYAMFFLEKMLKVDGSGQHPDDHRAADGHAVLPVLRLAVGQDRPQADHPRRLRAGGRHLFPVFHALTDAANPALAKARPRRRSVTAFPANARRSSIRWAATSSTPPAATSSRTRSPRRRSTMRTSPHRLVPSRR
jgi:hypothetical protein